MTRKPPPTRRMPSRIGSRPVWRSVSAKSARPTASRATARQGSSAVGRVGHGETLYCTLAEAERAYNRPAMLPASYQAAGGHVPLSWRAGVLACFLGYRLFRLVLAIYGFVLGALVATSVVAPVETSRTLATAVLGGVVGAAILILAYFVGVAFVGAALAALLVHVAWTRIRRRAPPARRHRGVRGRRARLDGDAALRHRGRHRLRRRAGPRSSADCRSPGQRPARRAAVDGNVWMAYPLNPAPGHTWTLVAWLVVGATGTLVQMRTPQKRKR